MKNDVEHGRALRVINYRGRYRLLWCDVNEDGDIVRVLKNEDVETSFKSFGEMKALIALVEEAKRLPITVITAANERMYFVGEG